MRVTTATLVVVVALGATACGDDTSDPRSLQDKARELDSQPRADETPEKKKKTSTQRGVPASVEGGDGNDRKIKISASDFPAGTWPLTIESGELRCEDTKTARTIIFSANGQDYPVNGVPEGGEIIGIEPIWKKKDDPNSPGTRMDITPLFKKGYELCG